MLPKIYRISKTGDFKNAFRKGKGFRRNFIFLKAVKNNLGFSRFGFVVSNKISKKSTVRHKIKRRLTRIIYLKLSGIKRGYDIVIRVAPEIKNQNYQKTEQTLNELLISSRMLNG